MTGPRNAGRALAVGAVLGQRLEDVANDDASSPDCGEASPLDVAPLVAPLVAASEAVSAEVRDDDDVDVEEELEVAPLGT
jgi:hypothetical protein